MSNFVFILICFTPTMIAELLCLLLPTDTLPPATHDSIRTDTLREVIVHGKQDGKLPVEEALGKTLGGIKRPPTLGDILEKAAPGLQDKMLHPFAIKQRKRERHKKKMRKALEHYEEVKTFNDLLKEAVKRQELEDEQQARHAEGKK